MPALKKVEAPEVPTAIAEAIASAIKVEDGSETETATNKPGVVKTVSVDQSGNKIEEH